MSLQFDVEPMLFDISQRCFAGAEAAAPAGETTDAVPDPPSVTLMKDVLEGENLAIVKRMLERCMWETSNILYPFTDSAPQTIYHNNNPLDVKSYVVMLHGIGNRTEAQIQLLKSAVHDYVVLKATAEWQQISMPQGNQWQITEQMAQTVREQVATALVMPRNIKRIKVRPHTY